MTEGLHHQIGGETKTGQIFQFVACHGAGSILGADGGHPGFAIATRTDPCHATGAPDYFLRQGEAFTSICDGDRAAKQLGDLKSQGLAGTFRQTAADNQRNATSGLHLVQQDVGL